MQLASVKGPGRGSSYLSIGCCCIWNSEREKEKLSMSSSGSKRTRKMRKVKRFPSLCPFLGIFSNGLVENIVKPVERLVQCALRHSFSENYF